MSIPIPPKLTITNLFTNPEGERTSGEVVVWENTWLNPELEDSSELVFNNIDVSPADSDGWASCITRSSGSPYIGQGPGSAKKVDVSEGSDWELSFSIRPKGTNFSFRVRHYQYDSSRNELSTAYIHEKIVISDEEDIRLTVVPESGVVDIRFLIYIYNATGQFEQGVEFDIRHMQFSPVGTPFWFGRTESPDPDLTAQARPGGGAQLVGTNVSGYSTSNGGVLVKSTQWMRSGVNSARYINNGWTSSAARLRYLGASSTKTVLAWRYQDTELTSSNNQHFNKLSYSGGADQSETAPNEAGDALLVLNRESSSSGSVELVGYFSDVGESMWVDLLTATDIPNYDGPPFSGDTEPFMYKGQMVFPKWDGEPHNSTSSFDYYESPGPWSPTITWDSAIQRAYHLGVSRGVLELDGVVYPWSGLTSAEISPDSEAPIRRFLDGVVYDVRIPPTNHQGKISAFTYPLEFEEFIGNMSVDGTGMRAHGQQYKPFNLAYRTEIGTEDGVEHYKLHFVYGAYAIPSAQNYSTINSNPEGAVFDFDILTTAQLVTGYRPTAYFTVDTREENRMIVESLENVMYGFEGADPWFPTIEQLREAFDR